MSDDPVIPLPPGRAVDIPARFIRQAFEHLQHTGDRYVTFIFAGEMVADAVCYGISTQRVPPSRMITDQRPESVTPKWSLQAITTSVVLEVIREHGPINAKTINDKLGIDRGDASLRQRTRRLLESLAGARVIRRSGGSQRMPEYAITRGSRPMTAAASGMQRKDITDEMVLEQLRTGPISSRDIGDNLGLDRKDNSVRSKITEIIGRLLHEDRVRHVSGSLGTGRMYELIEQQEQATG